MRRGGDTSILQATDGKTITLTGGWVFFSGNIAIVVFNNAEPGGAAAGAALGSTPEVSGVCNTEENTSGITSTTW